MSDGDTCAHYKYVKCLLCHQQRLLRADNDAESAEVKSWSDVFGGQLRASERSRFCWSCGAALASSYEPHLNSPLACPDCRVRMEGIRESNDDSPLDVR